MTIESQLTDPKTRHRFACCIYYDLADRYSSQDPDAKPTGQEAVIDRIDIDVWSNSQLEMSSWPIWEHDRYHKGGIPTAIWTSLKKQAIDAVEDSIKPAEQEAPE